MNRLSTEKSAYLKHAARQRIDWYPWSDEAFHAAQQEDRPVFLSTGAVWCHWCHVMAKECFENEEIIALLNEHFICIKLDRDERPDIDRRYQQAVIAMGSGGGWPLSVFLTPDKKPFFGGTYFPPEDSNGRPGFNKVLKEVAHFYKTNKEKIAEYTEDLLNFLRPAPMSQGELQKSFADEAVQTILAEFDAQNGGFGASPKFPMPGAMEFLINTYFFSGDEAAGYAIRKTLESMSKGGFHDQIGGGFHRYSTDEAWIIPHFEKMADDNAWLLRNYSDAYAVFGDGYFKGIAEGIITFVRDELSDPEGGFYASQDADVSPDDEGGYFTWTEEDFRKILSPEEYRVLSLRFFHERGGMHHDTAKKVLFVAMEPGEISHSLKMDIVHVNELIRTGKNRLLMERNRRQTPFVDRTLYTSLNGMFITSYLKAFRVLKDEYLKDFALLSLERIMKKYYIGKKLCHSEGVDALLDDYVYLAEALISAYELTGMQDHLDCADELMETCMQKFQDRDEGGFFDAERDILGLRLKAIEDIPHPSPNAVGILQMLRLFFITGKDIYLNNAEKALRVFSSRAMDMGLHSGYYFCAMATFFYMLKLTMQAGTESSLAQTALSVFRPYTGIAYAKDEGCVIPCLSNGVCLEPIKDPDNLRAFLIDQSRQFFRE